MSVRLGISPIGWSNDDLPELGGDIPLETCLAEAREAGFEGIELGHKFPREGATLKAKLASFEMAFVGGWYSTELLKRSAREEFEAAMEHFLATVCTHEWNRGQDAGRTFAEGARLLKAEHPDKAELIDAYCARFDEMMPGPIVGSVEILADLKSFGTPPLLPDQLLGRDLPADFRAL